jgi:hypothetical protein
MRQLSLRQVRSFLHVLYFSGGGAYEILPVTA